MAIEPFLADQVEVLRGPSTLLYGSGAIGGVVDVHTGRIPHEVPERPLAGGIETRFDSNTDGNVISGKLDGAVGDFAWHLDGTWKDGDDYEIPGFVESDGCGPSNQMGRTGPRKKKTKPVASCRAARSTRNPMRPGCPGWAVGDSSARR